MTGKRWFVAAVAALLAAGVLAGEPNGAGSPSSARSGGLTSVPRPDHIVVVVEENHAGTEVVGSADAPYINSLATSGANFTSSFAVTHPSQPNYLALFSGATQGLTDDSCPHSYSTASLGDQLIGAGLRFTGYSESMPRAGYTGCTKSPYARKHSPWINFPSLPAATNQPFTGFPSDYATLPEVSFVIPNLQNDMHDGTVAQGDSWLQANLDGYVQWAKTHNSVLVLTFDEDDYTAANRITTVIIGERVAPGTYTEQINHYNVLRTIEDAFGLAGLGAAATATPITDIWTAPSGGFPPTAAFTSSCSGLSCTFDASGSRDPDGAIVDYAWTFGDGATASGVNPTHAYVAGGRRTVTLSVTDEQGHSVAVSHTVGVTEPGAFAADLFGRTVTGGLGTADTGGAWTLTGSSSAYSVADGTAALSLTAAPKTLGAYLGAAVTADADVRVGVGLSAVPVGGTATLTVQGRRVSSGNEYDAAVQIKPDASVTLRVARLVNGTETVLAGPVRVTGIAYAAGQSLAVRLQVTGTAPARVRAKLWPTSAAEPSAWTVSATDTTAALQASGAVGVSAKLASGITNVPITAVIDSLRATPVANQPPTAAFTPSCTQLVCNVDASASSDADGTITTYTWDFGDGASGSAVSVQHAYAVAGTYTITLTVTDDFGSSASVSHDVVTTPPPLNQPPTASFTSSCPTFTCTFDGSGSTDDEGVVAWTWDFGNGAGGDGVTVSHVFSAAGSYPVALTVSDDDGSTNTATQTVVVTDQTFVRDAFGRTVNRGFGTADLGGPWTLSGSSPAFAVSSGVATITQAASPIKLSACVCGVTRTDADVQAKISFSAVPTGAAAYVEVQGRRVSTRNEYDAKLAVNPDRTMSLRLIRVVDGTETALTGAVRLPGALYTAGQLYVVRVQVTGTGTTSIRARAWSSLDAEPSTWLVSASDTTASLQAAGATGVLALLPSGVTNLPLTLAITSFAAAPTH